MGRGGVGVVVSVRVRVRVWVRSAVFLLKNWSTTPKVMIKHSPISVLYPR